MAENAEEVGSGVLHGGGAKLPAADVLVFGRAGCERCIKFAERAKGMGFAVEKHELDTLIEFDRNLRRTVMAELALEVGHYPIVWIARLAVAFNFTAGMKRLKELKR